jgi:CysZ protein
MIDAAIKALAQMFSAPFRTVLIKAIGLAVIVLVAVGIALQRLIDWLVADGAAYVEGMTGMHTLLHVLLWILAFVSGFGVLAGAIFLMPAVTSLIASFFADEIAALVEREHYPADPPGVAIPVVHAAYEGVKTALLTLLVYLGAVPFLLLAGFGALIFFLANAWLLGREYFELAAMRFHPVPDVKALRRAHGGSVFVAGMFIAAFVSIPILNLATPLFGTAFMVHMHKRIARKRR